ncbi:hypothetical protein E1B42_16190 [Salmonella enterica subsp. enterica serovar Agona]|uniref:Uncharacterized protein n=4 Tax=Salmonella enterica TaxID=28901 RepID=A0A701FL73_SALEN|nr:hypothetical protein SeAg_B4898 [Salmonella enterica subsp. enterica serovar Agona str. SL483]APY48732.1 hypothetical protein LFZ6_23840 [Salmonella enterica subsp. enterica serovar Borreze str. SA20041063]EAA0693838.1 hypothetical protein [Salmonella enterica subsp. enterica serovar Agona]EAA3398391.1 hypothetical protein [Salmonella enterica]EAA4417735.1 hypothetical protein [Salmonella enterica subsp. enterica serovar Oranienburg]EAA7425768.1 hypothetical protein [Salmonella enterica sub
MIGCKFNKIKSWLRKTLIIIGDDKWFIIRWVYEVRGNNINFKDYSSWRVCFNYLCYSLIFQNMLLCLNNIRDTFISLILFI